MVAQAPLIQARLLNALRETQLDHSHTQDEQSQRLAALEQGQQTLLRGQETIIGMLTELIDRDAK